MKIVTETKAAATEVTSVEVDQAVRNIGALEICLFVTSLL